MTLPTQRSYRKWGVGGLVSALAIAAAVVTLAHKMPPPHVLDVIAPDGKVARSTAILLTGREGWTEELAARANELSEMHTLVVGLDGQSLLEAADGSCAATAPLILETALAVQTREGALARTPVLTGYGSAAQLALLAADAAPERFKGLVTVSTGDSASLCGDEKMTTADKAPLRWLDVVELGAASAAEGIKGASVIPPTPTARRAFYQSYLRLAGTDSAFDTRATSTAADLQDLPLTLHHIAEAPVSDTYAIFLSGDGGWANFDKEISQRLAAQGVPVVGISSLRYMWREKTPEHIAHDLTRIDQHFSKQFDRNRVLILGFSLGANTLPFAAPHLPTDLQNRLAGLGLIAPETRTGFEIVVGGWLGQETGAFEVAPAIAALDTVLSPAQIMCLYGTKERVSACPVSDLPGMQAIAFEGGHHLGKDYDAVVQNLLQLLHMPTSDHSKS